MRTVRTSDFLTVLDVQAAAPHYGRIITTLPVGEASLDPHHTEYEAGPTGFLFANGFGGNRTFLFDVRNPLKPTVMRSFGPLESLTFLHSFARLPNGHVLAIFQGHGPQNAAPGRPPGSVFAR